MKRNQINYRRFLFLGLILFLITACAETVTLDPASAGNPAGFWSGLWHGIIVIISFVISLFKDDVAVYAANNVGGWYDFGFILGILIVGGGGGRSSKGC